MKNKALSFRGEALGDGVQYVDVQRLFLVTHPALRAPLRRRGIFERIYSRTVSTRRVQPDGRGNADKPCPKAGDGNCGDRPKSPSTVTPRKDGGFYMTSDAHCALPVFSEGPGPFKGRAVAIRNGALRRIFEKALGVRLWALAGRQTGASAPRRVLKPKAYGLKPFFLWLFPNELVISYDRETKRSRIFLRDRR